MGTDQLHIALVGNPNAGKTTLFNALTGMNQKVGNFPGVTVDKKTGGFTLTNGNSAKIIDLPGIYSLSPKSTDERVTCDVLMNDSNAVRPDQIVLVLDASNLKRNLFLATQVIDLGLPVLVALNMQDVAEKSGITINTEKLEELLGVPVVAINARDKKGIKQFKERLTESKIGNIQFFHQAKSINHDFLNQLNEIIDQPTTPFSAFKQAVNKEKYPWLEGKNKALTALFEAHQLDPKKEEILEISERYRTIGPLLSQVQAVVHKNDGPLALTAKLDKVLTHPIWGYVIFMAVFFVIFQAVFTLASYPMDWIDMAMGWISGQAEALLPEGMVTDFVVNGVIAGIGGIVIFIPQIMILFGLIEILEDTGYMARVSFLNDRILRSVGMNGKSVVPLVSGFACAVPAIMATRSIENWKERLITIMVTPLMSCSARLPVYIFLVGFIVPDDYLFGFVSLQGLFMLGLYLLGLVLSGFVALVFNRLLKSSFLSSFILELPTYRLPRWKNVAMTMWSKGLTFVTEAGKIIMIISIVLWVLSSFGPPSKIDAVEQKFDALIAENPAQSDSLTLRKNSELLHHSFAGIMGKAIEPAIEPLGFDWRMGIAVITSFAAREVFVSTMSIIYSVEGDADNIAALQERLKNEVNPTTGEPLMSVPTAASLLIFFVIAMQCMSTLAITKRETNSWKWPMVQFLYLTAMAYLASFATYQLLT
tara:strand:- start:28713 stop:30830 length:2118 start_codon:yes stop_codon:yes gene_type:complete